MSLVPLATFERFDPHCGGVLASDDVRLPLIEWCVEEICASAELLKFFTSTGEVMRWVKLATILQPVLAAIWAHHVAHSAGGDDDSPVPPDAYAADPGAAGLYVAAG